MGNCEYDKGFLRKLNLQLYFRNELKLLRKCRQLDKKKIKNWKLL